MKLLIVAVLVLSTFLAGCDKGNLSGSEEEGRYATLYFDKPVSGLYKQSGKTTSALYPDNIVEALRDLGVNVEGLEFKLGKAESNAIYIAIKDASFGVERQEELKRALSDVLDAKHLPAFSGHVLMDPDSLGYKTSQPQLYERSDNGVYIHPQSEMTVKLKYNTAGLYDLLRSHGNSEFYCYISSKINHDLPFQAALWAWSDKFEDVGSFDMAVVTWDYKRMGVKMTFDNKYLRRLLSEGKLGLVLNSQNPFSSMSEVSVGVGSLGSHSHKYHEHQQFGKLSSHVYDHLESKCQSMAVKLGRPFTFHFGDGIDRLKAVVYTNPST